MLTTYLTDRNRNRSQSYLIRDFVSQVCYCPAKGGDYAPTTPICYSKLDGLQPHPLEPVYIGENFGNRFEQVDRNLLSDIESFEQRLC
jgi:hypothetical protein